MSHDPWVQCGKSRLKWALFCKFLKFSREWEEEDISYKLRPEDRNRPFELLHSFIDARATFQAGKLKGLPRQTITDLLVSRRGLGVTDAHDIIFGHLGVATLPFTTVRPDENKQIPFKLTAPDYGKSTSQVFNEFAHDVIRVSPNFGILSFVEDVDPSQRRQGLASWAPDWTTNPLNNPQRIHRQHLTFKENTRQRLSSIIRLSDDCRFLAAIGEVIDVITEISEVFPWDSSEIINMGQFDPEFSDDFDTWYHSLSQSRGAPTLDSQLTRSGRSQDPVQTAEDLVFYIYKLYSQVLGLEFLHSKHRTGDWENWTQASSRFPTSIYEYFHSGQEDEGDASELDLSELLFLHTFRKKDKSILSGRGIAAFRSGRYAVVPSTAREGDVISLLSGITDIETFIFRPMDCDEGPVLCGLNPDFVNGMISARRKHVRSSVSENIKHYKHVGECCTSQKTWILIEHKDYVIVIY